MKRKKHIIPLSELWVIQKEITGCTDELLSMFELANVIAAIKGWPEIVERQPKYREFSKQYIMKYIDERDRDIVTSPVCWVYFVQQGDRGSIKIGVADNIERRIKGLQTGSPHKLNLLARIGCGGRKQAYDLENQLHRRFSSYRLEGEWFARQVIFSMHKLKEKIDWEGEDLSMKSFVNKVEKSKNATKRIRRSIEN